MSCRECRELIAPLIMNELSAEQAAVVEQHAAECVHCAAILAGERELQSALADRFSIPDPSPDFETRVMAAARSDDSARAGWSTPIVGGAIAAALALGIALGVGLKPGDDPSRVDMAEADLGECDGHVTEIRGRCVRDAEGHSAGGIGT